MSPAELKINPREPTVCSPVANENSILNIFSPPLGPSTSIVGLGSIGRAITDYESENVEDWIKHSKYLFISNKFSEETQIDFSYFFSLREKVCFSENTLEAFTANQLDVYFDPTQPTVDDKSFFLKTYSLYGSSIAREKGGLIHQINKFQSLDNIFYFRNKNDVINYLNKNEFLYSILMDAYQFAISIFNPPEYILELVTDPEASDSKNLLVSFKTDLEPKVALEKLNTFDDKWWFNASEKTKGLLNFNLEFK